MIIKVLWPDEGVCEQNSSLGSDFLKADYKNYMTLHWTKISKLLESLEPQFSSNEPSKKYIWNIAQVFKGSVLGS